MSSTSSTAESSSSSSQQIEQTLTAASNVYFAYEDINIAFNNSIALLESKFPLYKDLLLFLSNSCLIDEKRPNLTSVALSQSSPIRIRYFLPTWKILMTYIVFYSMIWSQNYPLVERKEGKRMFVTSDICLSQPPISQASESQHAEETEVTADATQNIGDVPLESFHDADKSPYDTESEIKIVKRFKPTIDDEESLFTSVTKEHSVIGDESDLESMPMDEIGSVSAFETFKSKEDDTDSQHIELSEERDANKLLEEQPSLSNSFGNLCKEVSNLTTKVQNLKSSLIKQMTDKLEEIVPSLVAETLKENLPKIISESLKIAILQIIAESVKEIIKLINKQFNTFNKLKAACFTKLYTGLKKDLKKKLEVSVRKEVHKGMETVKGKVDYCTTRVDQNTQNV
ncbi:hypothetical protein Tco_0552988 [Tanacetum coccineum]